MIEDTNVISRQAAKEAICDYVCGKDIRCVTNHECKMKQLISKLPSVQLVSSEDAVSKKYLKEDMIRYGWSHPDSTVTEYVDDLPSVEFEPKECGDIISRKALLEDLYQKDYTEFTYRDFIALVQHQDGVYADPKTSDDTISRDDVYKVLHQDFIPESEFDDEISFYIREMRKLPSVRIIEKLGHWEESTHRSVGQTGGTYDDGDALVCSECLHAFKRDLLWKRNFCPNCGARMGECIE